MNENENGPRCEFCGEEASARRDCKGCKLLHEIGLEQARALDAATQIRKYEKARIQARALAMKKQAAYLEALEARKRDAAVRLAYARDPNKSIADLIAPVPKVDLATVMAATAAPAAPAPAVAPAQQRHPRSGK